MSIQKTLGNFYSSHVKKLTKKQVMMLIFLVVGVSGIIYYFFYYDKKDKYEPRKSLDLYKKDYKSKKEKDVVSVVDTSPSYTTTRRYSSGGGNIIVDVPSYESRSYSSGGRSSYRTGGFNYSNVTRNVEELDELNDQLDKVKEELEKAREIVDESGNLLSFTDASGNTFSVEDIQERLTNLQDINDGLSEGLESASENNNELLNRITVLEDEKSRLESQINTLTEERIKLQTDLINSFKETERLQKLTSDISGSLVLLSDKLGVSGENLGLLNLISEIDGSVDDLRADINAKDAAIEGLITRVGQITESQDITLENIVDIVQSNKNIIEQQEIALANLERIEATIDGLAIKVLGQEEFNLIRVFSIEEKVDSIETRIDAILSQNANLLTLQDELDAVRQEKIITDASFAAVSAELAQLTREGGQIDRLEGVITNLRADISGNEARIAQLTSQIETGDRDDDAEIARLNDEIADLSANIIQNLSDIDALRDEIDTAKTALNSRADQNLQNTIDEITRELDNVLNNLQLASGQDLSALTILQKFELIDGLQTTVTIMADLKDFIGQTLGISASDVSEADILNFKNTVTSNVGAAQQFQNANDIIDGIFENICGEAPDDEATLQEKIQSIDTCTDEQLELIEDALRDGGLEISGEGTLPQRVQQIVGSLGQIQARIQNLEDAIVGFFTGAINTVFENLGDNFPPFLPNEDERLRGFLDVGDMDGIKNLFNTVFVNTINLAITDLQTEIRDLQSGNQDISGVLQELRTQNATLTRENQEQAVIIAGLRADISNNALQHNAAIQQLQTQFDAEKQQLEADFDAEKQQLEADFDAEKQQLEADFDAEKQQLEADFDAEKQQLEADFDAEKQQLEADFDAEIQQLQNELNDLTKQQLENELTLGIRQGAIEKLLDAAVLSGKSPFGKNPLENIKTQIIDKLEEIERREIRTQELQRQRDEERAAGDGAAAAQTQNTLDNNTNRLRILNSELDELFGNIEEVAENNNAVLEALEIANQIRQNIEQQIDDLENTNNQLKADMLGLALGEDIVIPDDNLNEALSVLGGFITDLEEALGEAEELQTELNEKTAEFDAFVKEIDDLVGSADFTEAADLAGVVINTENNNIETIQQVIGGMIIKINQLQSSDNQLNALFNQFGVTSSDELNGVFDNFFTQTTDVLRFTNLSVSQDLIDICTRNCEGGGDGDCRRLNDQGNLVCRARSRIPVDPLDDGTFPLNGSGQQLTPQFMRETECGASSLPTDCNCVPENDPSGFPKEFDCRNLENAFDTDPEDIPDDTGNFTERLQLRIDAFNNMETTIDTLNTLLGTERNVNLDELTDQIQVTNDLRDRIGDLGGQLSAVLKRVIPNEIGIGALGPDNMALIKLVACEVVNGASFNRSANNELINYFENNFGTSRNDEGVINGLLWNGQIFTSQDISMEQGNILNLGNLLIKDQDGNFANSTHVKIVNIIGRIYSENSDLCDVDDPAGGHTTDSSRRDAIIDFITENIEDPAILLDLLQDRLNELMQAEVNLGEAGEEIARLQDTIEIREKDLFDVLTRIIGEISKKVEFNPFTGIDFDDPGEAASDRAINFCAEVKKHIDEGGGNILGALCIAPQLRAQGENVRPIQVFEIPDPQDFIQLVEDLKLAAGLINKVFPNGSEKNVALKLGVNVDVDRRLTTFFNKLFPDNEADGTPSGGIPKIAVDFGLDLIPSSFNPPALPLEQNDLLLFLIETLNNFAIEFGRKMSEELTNFTISTDNKLKESQKVQKRLVRAIDIFDDLPIDDINTFLDPEQEDNGALERIDGSLEGIINVLSTTSLRQSDNDDIKDFLGNMEQLLIYIRRREDSIGELETTIEQQQTELDNATDAHAASLRDAIGELNTLISNSIPSDSDLEQMLTDLESENDPANQPLIDAIDAILNHIEFNLQPETGIDQLNDIIKNKIGGGSLPQDGELQKIIRFKDLMLEKAEREAAENLEDLRVLSRFTNDIINPVIISSSDMVLVATAAADRINTLLEQARNVVFVPFIFKSDVIIELEPIFNNLTTAITRFTQLITQIHIIWNNDDQLGCPPNPDVDPDLIKEANSNSGFEGIIELKQLYIDKGFSFFEREQLERILDAPNSPIFDRLGLRTNQQMQCGLIEPCFRTCNQGQGICRFRGAAPTAPGTVNCRNPFPGDEDFISYSCRRPNNNNQLEGGFAFNANERAPIRCTIFAKTPP